MKRFFSLLVALVLVCALAVSALAVSGRIGLNTDSSTVEAGEALTVVITMDEAIPLEDDTTMIQLELNYDQDSMTYASSTLGDGYDFLTVVASEKTPVIKINWIDIDAFDVESIDPNDESALKPARVAKELPAGVVATVTFIVNENVDKDALVYSLQNSLTASAAGAATHEFTGTVTVTVCSGHTDADGDNTCDNCGGAMSTVVMGDVNGDGGINTIDAMLVLQYAVGMLEADDLDLSAADVNGDGTVNTIDAMLILQYSVGLLTEFTAG